MHTSTGGTNGRWVTVTLAVNSAALMGIVGWLIMVSFSAGQNARQVEINTQRLDFLESHGSPGIKERLDSIEMQLKEMKQVDRDIIMLLEDHDAAVRRK